MKKVLLFLTGLIVVLLIIIVIKTMTFTSLQVKAEPVILQDFGNESATNLSKAVTFPTITYSIYSPIDTAAFNGFNNFLAEAYPLVTSKLKKEIFSEFSLLYTWEGKNPELKPVILMAHIDVVPPGETDAWTKQPFSGENDGTYIWGRGTLDNKASLISILEAVERLLAENYQPERTIYLAFGHDEEIGGLKGASVIASALKERGVEAEFILDEGMAITIGMVPMINKPVAFIGTSEKGYLSVKMTVEMEGGHSMAPAKETAISVLNKALYNILNNQMKANISSPVKDFIRYIGPELPFYAKAIFANKWLFNGIILNIYKGTGSGNALVRTTTAPTIINAGIKDNVIPTKAEAVINFRILPGEKSTDVIQHLNDVISDSRAKISIFEEYNEPMLTSPSDVPGFKIIQATIQQVYPEVIVAPTMAIGGTDTKRYTEVSKNIYRFIPIVVTSDDMTRTHGLDERTKISDFIHGISFYYYLIRNTDK
jgi:carboxypeptidase PM20D1